MSDSILPALPARLQQSAYVSAGGEAAWPREEALCVIEWLTKHDIAVLGGEVWLATQPGPTIPSPFIYTWDAKTGYLPSISWTERVKRTARIATETIALFTWHPDDHDHRNCLPYFNLTTCNESEFIALGAGPRFI